MLSQLENRTTSKLVLTRASFSSDHTIKQLLKCTNWSPNLRKLVTYGASLKHLVRLSDKFKYITHYELRSNNFNNIDSKEFNLLLNNIFRKGVNTVVIENLPVSNFVLAKQFCEAVDSCETLFRLEIRKIQLVDSKYFMKILTDQLCYSKNIKHLSIPFIHIDLIKSALFYNKSLKYLHFNETPNDIRLISKKHFRKLIERVKQSDALGKIVSSLLDNPNRFNNEDILIQLNAIINNEQSALLYNMEKKLAMVIRRERDSKIKYIIGQKTKSSLEKQQTNNDKILTIEKYKLHQGDSLSSSVYQKSNTEDQNAVDLFCSVM